MKIRKSFLPHTITDIGSTIFFFLAIPLIFWFELSIVLPNFHSATSWLFYFHTIMGTYILFNILANLIAVMIYDTSIKGEILTPPLSNETYLKLWRMCAVCETLTPPRSWHCSTCNTCILKRDHHCAFSGCCIGHRNQRFFLMLIFYVCIGTAYASIYNNYFIWIIHGEHFCHLTTAIKLIFPFAMLVWQPSIYNLYLLGYLINMIGMLFTGFLLIYHLQNLSKGSLVHDRANNKSLYNLGIRKNIEMVFGVRWYLTWLSPFVKSQLPHNGIHWETILEQSIKHK